MFPYHITNEIWAHRNWAVDGPDNGENGDAGLGIKIAPGGVVGDETPYVIAWQWSNGDPTFIAAYAAGYNPYAGPITLTVSDAYEPEWLRAFGAPDGEELAWLSEAIIDALPEEERRSHPGFAPQFGW